MNRIAIRMLTYGEAPADDEVIRKAFEEIRNGVSPDRFLVSRENVERFTKVCRELRLKKPPAAIALRLLALRKRGGFFSETTVRPRTPI